MTNILFVPYRFYGVKQNKYSSLVSAQVTMDDLFA